MALTAREEERIKIRCPKNDAATHQHTFAGWGESGWVAQQNLSNASQRREDNQSHHPPHARQVKLHIYTQNYVQRTSLLRCTTFLTGNYVLLVHLGSTLYSAYT